MTFIKNAVIFTAIAALVGGFVSVAITGTTVTATVPETITIDNTPEKIEALKESVIDRLLSCESAGYKEDDAIVMYDNNQAGTLKGKNVWSFGQLQWKVSTIQHYTKLQGETLTQKEAILLALDTPKARELAKYVIFETDGGIWNWKNCADKLKLGDEVAIIKKLSK